MLDLATITVVGDLISAEVERAIYYVDCSSATVKTGLTRATGGGLPGLSNLTRVYAHAA